MLIREAEHRDLPAILEIMNEAITNTTSIYDYEIRTKQFSENWLDKKRLDKMPVFIYEVDSVTVAYGSYGIFRAWDAYKYSVEHSIYVHKDFRSRGIGKKLLVNLIDRARKDGYHTMIAGVDGSNINSCDFHKKLGFREIGKFKEVGYKFNRWLDLVFLQLMLNE